MSAEITKENINDILKDLGKEYRKLSGKYMRAEIIMVGGGAILARYGFRELSYDIDAIIRASGSLKDAATIVGDKYGLAYDWLNSDFRNTESYSDKLYQHSKHFRTFANVLDVRVIEPEYLLATKLRSAREYKHDLSDIVGIISEEKSNNPNFTKEKILEVYYDMYGNVPVQELAMKYLDMAFATDDPKKLMDSIREDEKSAKQKLLMFQTEYPDALNQDNISTVLKHLTEKEKLESNENTNIVKTISKDSNE